MVVFNVVVSSSSDFLTLFIFFLYFSLFFHSLPYLHAVMMDEPRFAQPIPNVTVAVGRDANLPCVVEHLGAYKVNNIIAHFYNSLSLFIYRNCT